MSFLEKNEAEPHDVEPGFSEVQLDERLEEHWEDPED
jgi:hypothetical protein